MTINFHLQKAAAIPKHPFPSSQQSQPQLFVNLFIIQNCIVRTMDEYTSSSKKMGFNSSQKKGWINSFNKEANRQAQDFLKYLNSQQSQIVDIGKTQIERPATTLELPEKYYLICPELYESYRNEACIEEITGNNFKLQKFDKGRNEMSFSDVMEIELPNVAKLTVWKNGDYKLIYNEQVYFWHEDQHILDKYCVTI